MVIKEDGTKWACISCKTGHRVSGCTHTDRELFPIRPKGRPVTQCVHCRSERRKRSAHTKCECGDKPAPKEKCPHLREAEATADEVKQVATIPEAFNEHGHDVTDHSCCCNHGDQCVCYTTKDDKTVPAVSPKPVKAASHPKSRTAMAQSDGHITSASTTHHHKALQRSNTSHDVNSPYRVHKRPPSHSLSRRSIDNMATLEKSALVTPPARQATPQVYQEPAAINFDVDDNAFDPSIPVTGTAAAPMANAMATSYPMLPDTTSRPRAPTSYTSFDSVDWQEYGFDSTLAFNPERPALTSTTTNTMSELGEFTSPEMPPFAQDSFPGEQPASSVGLYSGSSGYDDKQQNRWSLPLTANQDFNLDFRFDGLQTMLATERAPQDQIVYSSGTSGAPSSIEGSDGHHSPAVHDNFFGFGMRSQSQLELQQKPSTPAPMLQTNTFDQAFDRNSSYQYSDTTMQSVLHTPVEDPFWGAENPDMLDWSQDLGSATYQQDAWPL